MAGCSSWGRVRGYGQKTDILNPFNVNQWRTVWKAGKAVKYLADNQTATFAISFELAGPQDSKVPGQAGKVKKPKGDDGDGDGNDKKKKFEKLRGLRHRLSNLSLRDKFRS